jgi:transposase
METIYERAAGLDVHKDTVVACVRVLEGRKVTEELAEFGTVTEELLALRDWLAAHQVQVIGMEPTSPTGWSARVSCRPSRSGSCAT